MKVSCSVMLSYLAIFVAIVSASPLALEREKEADKPMSVVDVPAGLFEPEVVAEDKPKPVVLVEKANPEAVGDVVKPVEKVEDNKKVQLGEGVPPASEDGPNVFGIRFPSILIIRRPQVFQDPFAGFQSPFFGGFNRRPIFAPPPFVDSAEQPEQVKERETIGAQDSKVDEQRLNQTVSNVIQRMHQQFNNVFANLFNPQGFAMPQRPIFPQFPPQPFFARPSIFSPLPDGSSEEDALNFDKLPANYKNSTSETKVIGGQLVTVNKTVHKISGNNSNNGFFHFSVINVRPNAPETVPEAEVVAPVITPAESVPPQTVVPTEEKTPEVVVVEMDPAMNEVDRADNEQLPEAELKSTYEIRGDNGVLPTNGQELTVDEDIVKIVPIQSEKLIQGSKGKPFTDLSSDIRVNNLMENSKQARVRALFDPEEVEIFEV